MKPELELTKIFQIGHTYQWNLIYTQKTHDTGIYQLSIVHFNYLYLCLFVVHGYNFFRGALHKAHEGESLGTFSFFYFQFQLICERCSYLKWIHQYIRSSKQMGHVMSCQIDEHATIMICSIHFCLSCQQSFLPFLIVDYLLGWIFARQFIQIS